MSAHERLLILKKRSKVKKKAIMSGSEVKKSDHELSLNIIQINDGGR